MSEKVLSHISTSNFFALIHKTSNMWASRSHHPLPPSSSPVFPYLNEHPRHGDEITHFWHFSAKSSMGAKIKLRERDGLFFMVVLWQMAVSQRNRQQGHFVLLYCLPEQNPLQADSPLVSAVEALISTSWRKNSLEVHGWTREWKHRCGMRGCKAEKPHSLAPPDSPSFTLLLPAPVCV